MTKIFRFLLFFLLFALVVSLSYLTVMYLRGDDDFWLVTRKKYTFETFLENLRQGNTSPKTEHDRIYALLKHLQPERLGNIRQAPNVPYDYRFFFQDVVPEFLAPEETAGRDIAAEANILESFRQGEDYVAKLLLVSGTDSRIVSGTRVLKKYSKRLEMTGTYSSEFNYPTGLFVVDGQVLNPVLQQWDGLVILGKTGSVHIKNINALEYGFRRFDIRASYQDYLDFLTLAEREKLSIFQTHLLIDRGIIDVSSDSQRRARRRAIFQDASQTVSIYDSFDLQPTLYELSEILKERYGATEAVNLDMGPFGYAARYENGKRTKIFLGKGQNIELSNILVFNYH